MLLSVLLSVPVPVAIAAFFILRRAFLLAFTDGISYDNDDDGTQLSNNFVIRACCVKNAFRNDGVVINGNIVHVRTNDADADGAGDDDGNGNAGTCSGGNGGIQSPPR